MSEYYKTGDARTLEPYFSRHMMAMTAENLDSKADIAMELAERDQRIALLEAAAQNLLTALVKKQYGTTPLVAWPDIAPQANALFALLPEPLLQEDKP